MTVKLEINENEKNKPLNPKSLQLVISDITSDTSEVRFTKKLVIILLNL